MDDKFIYLMIFSIIVYILILTIILYKVYIQLIKVKKINKCLKEYNNSVNISIQKMYDDNMVNITSYINLKQNYDDLFNEFHGNHEEEQ